jgi:predicted lipoprotein with Yx(FWY)xxD motif
MFSRSITRLVAASASIAVAGGLLVVSVPFSSSVGAQTVSASCADPVTSQPTGPATVGTASSPFGRVLVVGSGGYAGCSLYVLTSDESHALLGAPFACSSSSPLGPPCDTVLWPALLTQGAPIAGPGVNPRLLGTVTRSDFPGLTSVTQVTYAGQPLYRFFLDETPGETEGANLFDPVTSPTGIWYLVEPKRGDPATGRARLVLETATIGGSGPAKTVLAVTMNNDFSLFPNASFPVYTLTPNRADENANDEGDDNGQRSSCQGKCALNWPPVLTTMLPEAGPGVDEDALGVIRRPDGTHQVTYHGQPLYLFVNDAYIGGPVNYPFANPEINGAGAATPWGVFNTVPPLS